MRYVGLLRGIQRTIQSESNMCGGKVSAKDLSKKRKACLLFLPFPLHNLKIIIPSSRWQIFQLWCWSGHGHGFYPPSLLNVFFFISFMCDLLWKAQTCVVLLNVFLAASSNALILSFLSIYCFYTSFNQHRFSSLDTVYFVLPPLTILFSSSSSMLLFITIVAVDFVLLI